MNFFVKHESCPKCGSRDNLGRYSDGSAWCFGCGYLEKGTHPFLKSSPNTIKTITLPYDADFNYTSIPEKSKAYQWIQQYEITDEELSDYNILYSLSRQQLIFPIYDEDSNLLAWQARNFAETAKTKYFSQGPIHDLIYICGEEIGSDTIILVEDLISAIKIGRSYPCMPLWGSEASKPLITRLKGMFKTVLVWLDSDKWKNAIKISKSCQIYGLKAAAIYSEKDPKKYTDIEIKKYIEDAP